MKSSPRVFSLEEANALLPELESLLGGLAEKKKNTERLHDELLMHELLTQAELPKIPSRSPADLSPQIRDLDGSLEELEKTMEAIHALGCILRSVERGWVDFLGRRGDQWIYFCWRRGEKNIRFFHPVKDTTQRVPI